MRTTARQTRENRTITVDFQNEATYMQLLGDGKAFVECVLAFLLALGFQLKHKATCRGGECLTRHSHTPSNLVVAHWTSDVESTASPDFLLRHDLWTPFG